jgi:hypothetical protein
MTAALSSHFHAFCAFETSVAQAADGLETVLQRFGPVERARREGFAEALGWFLPLASFSSRYLLVPCSGWTVVLHNERITAAEDQLFPLSKAAACRGTYGSWAANGCVWHVAEHGRRTRSVVCYLDGDRWVFHQEGEPLPFENTALYERPRRKERLPAETVQDYLTQLVEAAVPPDWRTLLSQEIVCLERSTERVQVPIEEYEVEVDL